MARSYVGAKVRLLWDHYTTAGTRFREGTIMKVIGSSGRGGLWLMCYKRGHEMRIHGIKRRHVAVVSWPKKEEEEDEE